MMSFSEPSRSRPGRARVLIVDDSPVTRGRLRAAIAQAADFDVVGEAESGFQAIRLVHERNPDIVTLDLEMPELGGLETLAYIMTEAPRPVVIVTSDGNALDDVQAAQYGAVEVVTLPAGEGSAADAELARRLVAALRSAARARVGSLRLALSRRPRADAAAAGGGDVRCAVAVAASTGGPRALAELIPQLPGNLLAAVLVVQHMPPLFTLALARRLDELSALPVQEAVAGEVLEGGRVYIAPGGRHLRLERQNGSVRLALSDGEPVWGVRPAADILFASVAEHFGPRSAGVVLTGMGRDGARGLRAIREAGGWTAVQDEASAFIPSMPRAASPYAYDVLPLARLAGQLVQQVAARITPLSR